MRQNVHPSSSQLPPRRIPPSPPRLISIFPHTLRTAPRPPAFLPGVSACHCLQAQAELNFQNGNMTFWIHSYAVVNKNKRYTNGRERSIFEVTIRGLSS